MANKGWQGFSDWLGKTTGMWETSDAKSERDMIKNLRDRYVSNTNKLQSLIDTNTGIKGAKKALQSGMQNASNIAQNASNQSTQNARNAGMSVGQASALGANTGANTYADAVQNQQGVMQNAMNDQIIGQQQIGTNMNEAQKQSQAVLDNQVAVDEATGNANKTMINAGISALTGGLGGLGSSLLGKATGAIQGAQTLNKAKNVMNSLSADKPQSLNLDLANKALLGNSVIGGLI